MNTLTRLINKFAESSSDEDFKSLLAALDVEQKKLYDSFVFSSDENVDSSELAFFAFSDWYDLCSDPDGYKSISDWQSRVLATMPKLLTEQERQISVNQLTN